MLRLTIASVPVLLPFFVVPFLLDATLLPGFVLLSVYSIVFWLIIARRAKLGKEIQLPTVPVTAIFSLLFVLWSGISITYTIAPPDALFWWAKWAALLMFGSGLSILLSSDGRLQRPLLMGIIVSAIGTCLVGIYQLVPILESIIAKPDLTYKVTGLMGHKNLFSSWLMLLLPLVLLGIYRLSIFWKVTGTIAIIMMAGTLFLVQSRAAWLALFLAGVAAIAILLFGLAGSKTVRLHMGRAYGKRILLGLTLPLLAVVVFLIIKPKMYQNIKVRVKYSINFNGPRNQDNETIKERLFLWGHTWNMITEKPILGHGAGAWRILFPQYGLQETRSQQGYIHFQRPHNDWLWVWAEYGLVGLVLLAGFWFSAVGLLIKMFLRQKDPQEGITALLLLVGVLSFLINAIFDFPMERSTHLGIMGIMVALAVSQGGHAQPKAIKLTLPIGMVLLSLVCLGLFYLRTRGEALAIQAYKLHGAGNYQQAIDMAHEAESFIYRIDGVSAPMGYYIGNSWLMLQKNDTALAALQSAYKQHPNHLLVLNNLGSAWQFVGENDSAKHYYRQAIRISPRFEEPLLNMGALYFNDRNTDSAYYYLSTVYPDSKNPRYRPSMDAMLKVEVRLLKQIYAPDSPEWQKLNNLESRPELLFHHYLKAWEHKNRTYERLGRTTLDSILLARP